MAKMKTTCLILILCCLSAFANEATQYTPARFAESGTPLPSLIEFPYSRKDVDVLMKCDTVITDTGALTRIVCYGPDRMKMSYKNAIYDVIKGVKFVPATVNGAAETVVMQFSLHFVRKDGEESISLYLNHGDDADKYGTGYFGVQRYDWGQWSSHDCRGHHRRYLVRTRASIGSDGSYQSHKLSKGADMELGPCEADFHEHVKTGSYIPAIADGVPVQARYVETFLNYLDPKVSY